MWLQSGLHYYKHGIAVAKAFFDAGHVLRDQFPLPANSPGVMRIPTDHQAQFREVASGLGVAPVALSASQAARCLGPFFRPTDDGSIYFRVPDTTFPEAEYVDLAREEARRGGALLRQTTDAAVLVPGKHGADIQLSGINLDADYVLLAAGCSTGLLLNQLQIPHGLSVTRTPLLVVHNNSPLEASLLVDRALNYSVTQPKPTRLVFGTRFEDNGCDPSNESNRNTRPAEKDILYAKFTSATGQRPPPSAYGFHVGYEIAPPADSHPPPQDLTPFIGQAPEFPNLLWTLPGRATMAWSHAQTIVDRLDGQPVQPRSPVEVGETWIHPVRMYFDESYDSARDRH